MSEYSRQAKGYFTSTGAAQTVYLPFQPDLVKFVNYSAYFNGATASVNLNGLWDVNMGQGFAVGEWYNSSSVLVGDAVTSAGISSFGLLGPTNAGLALQLGPQLAISGITKASAGVVTTASPHGLSSGQVVILEGLVQSSTTGMQQIASIPFVITVTSTTAFSIPWNTNQSNFTALSGSPAGAYVRQVLYPNLYLPQQLVISAIGSSGGLVQVTTTTNHNLVVGQEIAFRIPSVYGSTQLNSLPNAALPGSPVYYYVTSLSSNNQFICSASSTGVGSFDSNQPFASYSGQQFPQVIPVGDVNSGGAAYSGSALYPSPSFPTYSGGVSTVNGPAIQGAFVNNTAQGFIIGAGVGQTVTSATTAMLVGQSGNVIYWEAFLHDYSYPK